MRAFIATLHSVGLYCRPPHLQPVSVKSLPGKRETKTNYRKEKKKRGYCNPLFLSDKCQDLKYIFLSDNKKIQLWQVISMLFWARNYKTFSIKKNRMSYKALYALNTIMKRGSAFDLVSFHLHFSAVREEDTIIFFSSSFEVKKKKALFSISLSLSL